MTKEEAIHPFTEHDFVAVLLPLLHQNGVYKIKEKDLEKALFSYYQNPDFKELFQEVFPARNTINHERVDLQQGLYQEKYFGCNVVFDQMHSDILLLTYDKDWDFSCYESDLSEDAKSKIRRIAKELGIRYHAEHKSNHKLAIYGVNPNSSYQIIEGERMGEILGFQLITDGDIKSMEEKDTTGTEHIYYESPIDPDTAIQIRRKKIYSVELENASFAIKRGFFANEINYSSIYTESVNPEELEKMVTIANQQDTISKGKHYVKRNISNLIR